ncbi:MULTISPECIES: hypothetical protein [unclassified Micromonospora]|uniref:hypothetical protein n=1 Tax=unclassified Micromonospora TaxID=2617518 RepID=UPI0022C7DD3E|nr:hypothetical protein [Micromonospora sp. AKA38]GHJ16070.1 hypothetical protein TPA0908_40650 [Micromonospora sp. AKA38]
MSTFLDRFATGRRRLVGLSLLRIGLGATTALIYLANFPYRDALYGPNGTTSFASFSASQHSSGSVFSLYRLSDGETWFNLVYLSGLVAALVWTVLGGRALTLVNAIFIWSLDQRNPNVLDGGDNLARILLLLLVFATTNAYLSPLAARTRARLTATSDKPTLLNSVHNAAGVLVVFQICVVYAMSSFWKIVDTRWREGNALYYISQLHQFQYSDTATALMHNAALVTLACYLTITVQLAVVLLVPGRNRRLREIALLLVIGMHLGIGATMGLVSFAFYMIAADCALLSDDDYRATRDWLRRRFASAYRRNAPVSPAVPAPEPDLVGGAR